MTKSRHTGKKFSRESQLYAPVAEYVVTQGFRLTAPELPFYEYRIDLYGFSKRRDQTIAVELKLTNWKKALDQAMLYQLCSDIVYVAMPSAPASRADVSQFISNGIGLVAVGEDGRCSLLLEAKEHSEVRQFYRSAQIEYLREGALG